MENESFYSMLGLANRAGKVVKGSVACETGIKSGKIKLLLVDGEASAATQKSFADACRYYKVEMILLDEEGALGQSLGRREIKIAGIADISFAENLKTRHVFRG